MLIIEYRIPMPLTTAEYQIAQLYSVAQASKSETGNGEGVQMLINDPYDPQIPTPDAPAVDPSIKAGQYTHKVYHLSSRVPSVIRVVAPTGSLTLHEKAWNAFPVCKTVMTNEYMADKFQLAVESRHIDGPFMAEENSHNLDQKMLAKRQVKIIDIFSTDGMDQKSYNKEEDPRLFKSKKTGRGPLGPDWMKTYNGPMMTCYKLVTVEFKWFGLQGTIEALIQKMIHGIFAKFHRQVFCWMDQWHGLTMADIRLIEEEAKRDLDLRMQQNLLGPVPGGHTEKQEEDQQQQKQ